MQNFSNHLINCRSRLLDADALLNHLRKPENLEHLLNSDSPEVTLGALIERSWSLVLDACGDTEIMCNAQDSELPAQTSHSSDNIDALNEIHAQTGAMLAMLQQYLDQAIDGGETFNEHVLSNYVWQLMGNMERAEKAADALWEQVKK